MTDTSPAQPTWVGATWKAAPDLAARSNILGPYILILTAMVGAQIGVDKQWMGMLFGAGLLAWKDSHL